MNNIHRLLSIRCIRFVIPMKLHSDIYRFFFIIVILIRGDFSFPDWIDFFLITFYLPHTIHISLDNSYIFQFFEFHKYHKFTFGNCNVFYFFPIFIRSHILRTCYVVTLSIPYDFTLNVTFMKSNFYTYFSQTKNRFRK